MRVEIGECPMSRSIDLIGDRWSLLIVRNVLQGMHRFGDLHRDLGVARNILSDRLRRLTTAGVLAVRPASDGRAFQEYALTDAGEALAPVVAAFRAWGERFLVPGEDAGPPQPGQAPGPAR